jgi:hypothetical protein
VAGLGSDDVNQLPVTERVTVPTEMGRQVSRGLRYPLADDEPQLGFVELAQVRR